MSGDLVGEIVTKVKLLPPRAKRFFGDIGAIKNPYDYRYPDIHGNGAPHIE